MVLSKLWSYSKWWAETLREATVIAFSPNMPIPPTKLHPRMPPMYSTYGELFRMLPVRYMFQRMAFWRIIVVVLPVSYLFAFVLVPYMYPSLMPTMAESAERRHKTEEMHSYGYNQKAQDREYFKKHDPLRKFRPHAYDLVYGKGSKH